MLSGAAGRGDLILGSVEDNSSALQRDKPESVIGMRTQHEGVATRTPTTFDYINTRSKVSLNHSNYCTPLLEVYSIIIRSGLVHTSFCCWGIACSVPACSSQIMCKLTIVVCIEVHACIAIHWFVLLHNAF